MASIRYSRLFASAAVAGVVVAFLWRLLWASTWRIGYDTRNCPNCESKIDWSREKSALVVEPSLRTQFEEDGVVLLRDAIPRNKVSALAAAIDTLPNTFMSDVLARVTLPQYKRYEHRLDTRSQVIRDWAVHGPLGKWAAELLGVDGVRLYNAEIIFHAGADSKRPCSPSWHRDTIAAPFPVDVRSVTFNVYLDNIGPDAPNGDVLIYMKGSHRDLEKPPSDPAIFEPSIAVGDILAHDANVLHTPSGRGCWNRSSLQLRYFASTDSRGEPSRFRFDRNRWPHGPIPWSFAHSPELFPHGLAYGDVLSGPGYPLVFPNPLEEEHRPLDGNVWTIRDVLAIAKEAENKSTGDGSGSPPPGFMTFDGPVSEKNAKDFVVQDLNGVPIPLHKEGPGYKQFLKTGSL